MPTKKQRENQHPMSGCTPGPWAIAGEPAVLSKMWHPLRYAALAAVTAGACSLSLVTIAQAVTKGNPAAVHKLQLHGEPISVT